MSCGSLKGWQQHRSRNEPPCKWCAKYDPKLNPTPPPATPARTARPLKPCGTYAAYARHLKRGEPIDADCAKAGREHRAQYTKVRK